MNAETKIAASNRVAELVEAIERAERFRDFYWRIADAPLATPYQRTMFNAIAASFDESRDTHRAELRELIGVDAYRLANAIGATS